MPRKIAILGSTGSIGCQALDVISRHPEQFSVEVLSAHSNAELLIRQAGEWKPNAVVITDNSRYERVRSALDPLDIKVYRGEESLVSIVESGEIDMVLAAIVGFAGLKSTLRAVESGKAVALANKETLVVGGSLITAAAREKGVNIYPVDSEHSAIFQCMAGEFHNPVEKIILTASGGPFRGKNTKYLRQVTPEMALAHPNWNMGPKITIDSASLMNKGLEVIEARWLFNLKPEQIEVVIHPQSLIHSMVQFADGSIKAQMGLPDMRLPIQYALAYPKRLAADYPRLDFRSCRHLDFEEPDMQSFRNLGLAYHALQTGGCAPCILNAANEVAVAAFLRKQCSFTAMSHIIEDCMQHFPALPCSSLEELVEADRQTRAYAELLINQNKYTI